MRSWKRIVKWFMVAGLAFACVTLPLIPTGCGSTPTQVAVKSQSVASTGIATAMEGWGQWVKAQRAVLDDRKARGEDISLDLAALEAKRFRVKDLYTKYQIAMRASLRVSEALITSTNKGWVKVEEITQELVAAQKDLLNAITELRAGKTAGVSTNQVAAPK